MKHITARLTGMTALFLLLAFFARPGQATAPTSFNEEFDSSTLDPAWRVFTFTGKRVYGYPSPANHSSLTENPGHLRYSLDPMTHQDGFLNNYQTTYGQNNYDPGLEFLREFSGEHWVFETKADYYMPYSNGRGLSLRLYFGDGNANTFAVTLERYRDVYWSTNNRVSIGLMEKFGPTLADVRWLENFAVYEDINGPAASTYFYRVERAGSLLTAMWSADGVTWTTAFSRDMGAQLDSLEQHVAISGASWHNPVGSYADYDYVRLTPSDTTAPAITPTLIGTLGANDWYTSDVTISWEISDLESGIASSGGCETTTLSTETSGTTLTCSATNGAGLTNSVPVTIKLDKTPPIINGSRMPAPNPAGWNNTDVTVRFDCADALSGVAIPPLSPQVVGEEGAGQSRSATCEDNAGHSIAATVDGINIDKTAPAIAISSPQAQAYPHAASLNVVWATSDLLSGIASEAGALDGGNIGNGQSLDLFFLSLGSHAVMVTASDNAENTATVSVTFDIVTDIHNLIAANRRACALGWISKPGVCHSLKVKLLAARAAIERGCFNAAKHLLNAYIAELEAQRGRAVNEQAYNLLKTDALYVISTLPER